MTTQYVATGAQYALLDAVNEVQVRAMWQPALAVLYRERLGKDVPVEIHTVRLATGNEAETMSKNGSNHVSLKQKLRDSRTKPAQGRPVALVRSPGREGLSCRDSPSHQKSNPEGSKRWIR